MIDILIKVYVNSILDALGCGAKHEGEEDAAGAMGSARDEALHVTGSAEGAGEGVAERCSTSGGLWWRSVERCEAGVV